MKKQTVIRTFVFLLVAVTFIPGGIAIEAAETSAITASDGMTANFPKAMAAIQLIEKGDFGEAKRILLSLAQKDFERKYRMELSGVGIEPMYVPPIGNRDALLARCHIELQEHDAAHALMWNLIRNGYKGQDIFLLFAREFQVEGYATATATLDDIQKKFPNNDAALLARQYLIAVRALNNGDMAGVVRMLYSGPSSHITSKDPVAESRKWTCAQLVKYPETAIPALISALEPNYETPWIVYCLGLMGDQRAVHALRKAKLRTQNYNARAGIDDAIAKIMKANEGALSPSRAYPPAGTWRGLHLSTLSNASLEKIAQQLPVLSKMGINVLVLEVDYGYEFRSHPELREGTNPITISGARKFAEACRDVRIRLIPEINCLGHQSWKGDTGILLTKYPELDMTPEAFPGNKGKVGKMDFYCREWNPYDPKVYEIMFPLIDELIDAFEADAFHVGMDEVFLIGNENSPATRGKNPAEVFAYAVNKLHSHIVGEKHVEMLMWADRLIDGKKLNMGEWEASRNGTWPAVDLIPKDIILCPWHYEVRKDKTYPSIPLLVSKGFRVLPSGWNKVDAVKDLIHDSRKVNDPKMLGILFTTWESSTKEWSTWPPIVEGLKTAKEQVLTK